MTLRTEIISAGNFSEAGMTKIFKYVLTGAREVLNLPVGARLLHCHMQRGVPAMWFAVNPSAPLTQRCFVVFGTGHIIPDDVLLTYCGTVHDTENALVWHIFEIMEAGADYVAPALEER